MTCIKCIVYGRVQGVWFRDTTRQRARELGLCGHARNLADGSVEVIASGEADSVKTLQDWLWQGSPMSQVSAVECQEHPPVSDTDFTIG